MASKTPSRALRPVFNCPFRPSIRASATYPHHRQISSAPTRQQAQAVPPRWRSDIPRWQRTPEQMVAPVRTRKRPINNDFDVNEDPRLLDEVYIRMLGKDGDKLLEEEVKWLAVTHKSFDHGRRGFNDRLAYLGRSILDVQTSLALLDAPRAPEVASQVSSPDEYGRTPFQHVVLDGLPNLTKDAKWRILDKGRLAQLAQGYGLNRVVRWKPRQAGNLKTSGMDSVLAHSIYAIIGAIALQRGGEIANDMARERVLRPLGLLSS